MKRHKAAVYAQWRYGNEYELGTTAAQVFESLDPNQKQVCRIAVNDILAAPDEDGSANPDINTGGLCKECEGLTVTACMNCGIKY